MNRFATFIISLLLLFSLPIFGSNKVESRTKVTIVVFGKVSEDYFVKSLSCDINNEKDFKRFFGKNTVVEFYHVPSGKRDLISIANEVDEFTYLPVYGQTPSCKFSFCDELTKIDFSDEFSDGKIKKITIGTIQQNNCATVDNYQSILDVSKIKFEVDKAVKKEGSLVIYDLNTVSTIPIINADLEIEIGKDEKVSLKCIVDKNESSSLSYEWYINGELSQSKKTSSVKINADDQRNYQCVVKDNKTGCKGQTEEYTHIGVVTNKNLRFEIPKEMSQFDRTYKEYLNFGPTSKDIYVVLTSRVPGCDIIKIKVVEDATNKKVVSTEFNYQDILIENEYYLEDVNKDSETDDKEMQKYEIMKRYSDYLVLFLSQSDLGTKWEDGNDAPPLLRVEISFLGKELDEELMVSKKIILHRCPIYLD